MSTLLWFLFGTFFGWWILFLVAAAVLSPIAWRIRTWARARRFMAAQSARMENPQNAEVRRELAQLYLEGWRYAKAEGLARRAIEIATSSPLYEGAVPYLFWRVLAEALVRRRRWAEAAPVLDEALKSKSETGYFEVLLLLSRCHWKQGNAVKALEWAQHASRENTSSLEAYFRRAQAAAKAGDAAEVDAARAAFVRTKAVLPKFSRERRIGWALAFWMFPVTRRIL